MEFTEFPKIARLNRQMTVTEKVDGTNAAVVIQRLDTFGEVSAACDDDNVLIMFYGEDDTAYGVGAQSRSRLITPEDDNFGFAKWVQENAEGLFLTLGEGVHFGEWYGKGIQRGYGLSEKRFALFNTARWGGVDLSAVPQLDVVPVLYAGAFSVEAVDWCLGDLDNEGSRIAPGFDRPEGVIVFHKAANLYFKATIEGDEEPKTVYEKKAKAKA